MNQTLSAAFAARVALTIVAAGLAHPLPAAPVFPLKVSANHGNVNFSQPDV